MKRFLLMVLAFVAVGLFGSHFIYRKEAPPPANTETLTCVRVKEVTPAGTINYLCEVRK